MGVEKLVMIWQGVGGSVAGSNLARCVKIRVSRRKCKLDPGAESSVGFERGFAAIDK